MINKELFKKIKYINFLNKRDFTYKNDYIKQHSFTNHYSKSRKWYFRNKLYEDLSDNSNFKSYKVINKSDFIELKPIDPNKYTSIFIRDFHNIGYDNNDINQKSINEEVDAQLNLCIEDDTSNLEQNAINNNYSLINNETKLNNNLKVGVFWIGADECKRSAVNSLFEYNNFIPISKYYNVINSEEKSLISFSFKFQNAPYNPIKFETFILENNYFDILNYNFGYNQRLIYKDDIDKYTYILHESIQNYIKGNDIDLLFLGGFSQGACMALHTFLTANSDLTDKIKGIICLNGFLFNFSPVDYERLKNCSILAINGLNDDIVVIKEARDSYENLKHLLKDKNNLNNNEIKHYKYNEFYEEPGLYHSYSRSGLFKTKEFIKNISLEYALKHNNDKMNN